MTAPPAPPTAPEVARLARTALGLDRPPAVSPVGEGGEHHSWWVADGHVARFSPDPEASRRQRRERALRDLVRPYAGVPLPRSAASGEWAAGCGFTLDTRLRGASGEERTLSRAGERRLAGLLRGLRRVPLADAAALGVPVAEPVAWERLTAGAEAARLRLADTESVAARQLRPPPQAAGRVLATGEPAPSEPAPSELAPSEPAAGGPVLLHADLKGEHLVVGPDGDLVGVLDWADAQLGMPAQDIAGVAISVGAQTAARIAQAAGHGPATAACGLFLARCETLLRLDERLREESDSPLPLLRAQLTRAWEEPEQPEQPEQPE